MELNLSILGMMLFYGVTASHTQKKITPKNHLNFTSWQEKKIITISTTSVVYSRFHLAETESKKKKKTRLRSCVANERPGDPVELCVVFFLNIFISTVMET